MEEVMKIIDGKMFREMIVTGATVLHNNHPEVDALNVFPVPDGDTGTNMSLTFTSGATEVERLDSDRVDDIAKTVKFLACDTTYITGQVITADGGWT